MLYCFHMKTFILDKSSNLFFIFCLMQCSKYIRL
uniref:Uncharacterized protein n=1 Tax=Myoviridae sp. ctNQV2 TaxID=2827683 RepID=A0A8S5S0L3_9CAUD|nr:MAG TPA: hypothetical protein [Myoviridae sp. ctNQV2]